MNRTYALTLILLSQVAITGVSYAQETGGRTDQAAPTTEQKREVFIWRNDRSWGTGGQCWLRIEIDPENHEAIFVSSESRTRFYGFFPRRVGEYRWRSTTAQGELGIDLEELTVTFALVNQSVQPVGYVYQDLRRRDVGRPFSPKSCYSLVLSEYR